ncbi:MAG TPA: hypothetical protein DFI01_00745 [Bacteroidales bacterium]|nr:hypothetical protein [Bacteroidales bacterium]
MLRDPEFEKLSPSATKLWLYLRAEYNPNNEIRNLATNEIQVYLPYSKAENINGFSAPAMSRALKELIKAGFIRKGEQGGLYNGRSAYVFVGKYADFPNHKKKGEKR